MNGMQYKRNMQVRSIDLKNAPDVKALASSLESHLKSMQQSIMAEFQALERALSQTAKDIKSAGGTSGSSSSGSTITVTNYFRSGQESLTGNTANAVLFSSDLGITPSLFSFRCYNSLGESIGCDITSLTSTGFTANPLEDCTIEYIASKQI